jgi:hypothetical protein
MRFTGFLMGLFLAFATISNSCADEVESDCYRFIYAGRDFTLMEVEHFARGADERCENLLDTMGLQRSKPIPVYLKKGRGISTTVPHKNKAIDLFYARPVDGIRAPLVHETTHILADSSNQVLREGLAVVMEQRAGVLKTHPTYGFTIGTWMAGIRCAEKYVPLEKLENADWRGGPWERNIIAYVESGAFVNFLIDRHGLEAVLKAMEWTRGAKKITLARILEERFNESLNEQEEAWLDELPDRFTGSEAENLCQALKVENIQKYLRRRLREGS